MEICANIKNDDIVFIYVGKTYHEIRYKCKVISEDISDITLMENQYAIPKGKISNRCCYVKMKLIREYPKNTFPLSDLKKYGMGQFMVPMRANETILRYLLDKEKNLDWGDE